MSNNNDNDDDDEENQIVTNPNDPIYTDMSSNTNNYKLVQLNNRCYWCGSCCYNDNIEKDPLNYFRVRACCYKDYPLTNFDLIYSLINDLHLNDNEKKMILWRIQRIYSKISCLQKIYKYSYFYSRLFIVLASILSPALTGINTNRDDPSYVYIWWLTWNLQLLISIVTSVSTFFKWDRNYFLYSDYKDNIEEEVWHYLECINDYAPDCSNNNFIVTHEQHLNKFLNKLEGFYKTLCLKDSEIKLNTANSIQNKKPDTETKTSDS